MKFNETFIKDVYVIEPNVFSDSRGFFMETYNANEFAANGLHMTFVQDNHSMSQRNVLRGLHFQVNHPQGKLVRVIKGEVFDVAVDLRKDSPTYAKYFGVVLSESNKKMLYVPENFAHGFLVLSDVAEFVYKCTKHYVPNDEDGIIWNDETINIDWPIASRKDILLSDKDKAFGNLK